MLLDGAIVGASLFVVAWVTLLRDVYSATGVTRLDESLSIACPIAGVVTVTVAVLGLARANAHWRQTLILLTTGLTLIAAAGGAYVFSLAPQPQLPGRQRLDPGMAGGSGACGNCGADLSRGYARDVP